MISTLGIFLAVIMTMGCVTFPRSEARAKAKILREKGYHQNAENLERKAEDLPETEILIGDDMSEYDPRNDPYHFPELQVPEEKRRPTDPRLLFDR